MTEAIKYYISFPFSLSFHDTSLLPAKAACPSIAAVICSLVPYLGTCSPWLFQKRGSQTILCDADCKGTSAVKIPDTTHPSAVGICLTSFIFTAGISWNVPSPQESRQRGIYSTVTNLRSQVCLFPGIPLHPWGKITQLTKNVTAPQNK